MNEDDYISRKAVLKALRELLSDWDWDYNVPLERAIHRVKALPSVNPKEPKTEWVPVGERLPEETERVLVYAERNAYDDKGVFRKKVIEVGWQVNGMWHIDGCSGVDGIAWMPLPDPYKAKSEVSE